MSEQKSKKLKRLQPKQEAEQDAIRVLYVEDATVIRDTMARLLELKGYKVANARNGKEGVAMAQRWKPHIVLMDLRMPVMDGYKAISQIKTNPKTRHIPVFVVSAWSGRKERNQARLAGADEFFVKPPDLERLTEAIEIAVAAARGQKPSK